MQDSPVKELLKRGMQASLDEHQVPLHMHLKVVEALSKSMTAHKADLNLIHVMANRHALQLNEHDAMTRTEREAHQSQIAQYDEQIRRLTTIDHLRGDPGYTPQKGIDYADGTSPAIEDIVEALKAHIPAPLQGTPGKDAQFDKEGFKKELVDFLRETKPLDISHIKNSQSFIKDGIKYKIEELMRGAGGSAGSLSGTQEKSTTVPNGVLTTFAFAHTPKVIVWNGAIQTLTDDYTVSGNNITFTVSAGVPLIGDKILNIYA